MRGPSEIYQRESTSRRMSICYRAAAVYDEVRVYCCIVAVAPQYFKSESLAQQKYNAAFSSLVVTKNEKIVRERTLESLKLA